MTKSFDRVAKLYKPLERLAFRSDLMLTRTAFLSDLKDAKRVLILGEGDGRFLAQLLAVNAHCQVDCVDKSGEMLRLTQQKVADLAGERVTFYHRDALTFPYPTQHYDLVVTLFFLDVFTAQTLGRLVHTLASSLQPTGLWYVADFQIASGRLRGLYSRLWLELLYGFFNWQTDIEARSLTHPSSYLSANGLELLKTKERHLGMLYGQLWGKR